MNIEKVTYMLMAQDMARAVRFYTKTIGLGLRFESPQWTELTYKDATIALHGGHDGSRNRTGLSFQVSDIAAACAEATAGGAKLNSGPDARPGEPIKLADLTDTEGNEIMFTEYIGEK